MFTHGLHVPAESRSAVLAALRERKAALKANDCNYWVFEGKETPGVLIEFYEARDVETLERACTAAGRATASQAILFEVEL
ncbi:MAG: hypothetical protein IT361_08480 [Gemmatimonadaceae bacterium]|nr:hypothetical protein [Gemmatimonadaceae bacterium]